MRKIKYLKALISVVLLIVLDQWTKSLAVLHLMGKEDIPVVQDVFVLHYLENRGSAFGMLQNQQLFFIIFTLITVIGIIILYTRLPETKKMKPLSFIFILIVAGAIGNFIDRVKQGFVVDFLYFVLIDFPVFNVADIYVTVAAFLLVILVIFYYKDEDFEFIKGK